VSGFLSKRMSTKKKDDRALPECRCGMVSSLLPPDRHCRSLALCERAEPRSGGATR
jgi:hypothetical protein